MDACTGYRGWQNWADAQQASVLKYQVPLLGDYEMYRCHTEISAAKISSAKPAQSLTTGLQFLTSDVTRSTARWWHVAYGLP